MSDEFSESESTLVTPLDVQDRLLHKDIDTDPEFQKSEFWFRFQHMERELISLRESYSVIYKIMQTKWDRIEDIPNEYLKIIFEIARNVVEGIPPDQDEITITT